MKKMFLLIAILLTLTITNVQAQFVQDVIVTSSNGIWTDSRAYATLNDAVTAVGANKRTIVISSQQSVTTLTIPSTVTLRFERDGSIANSAQLTINTKNIEADNHQIFTGVGNIDFAPGTIVKSTWFQNIETAFALTSNDTITLLITAAHTVTASYSPGNNVLLKWDSPGNILTTNAGVTVGNLKLIEAGNFQIFGGAGDFDFLDGTYLKTIWFNRLRSAVSWVESESVTIEITYSETLDMNLTVPENIILSFNNTTISGAFTLAFVSSPDSQIKAPSGQQIFGSTITITFGVAGTLSAKWWPATGDGTTDDTAAFDNVIACAIASGSSIHMPAGTYLIDDFILNNGLANDGNKFGQEIYGDGTNITILKATGNSAKFLQFKGDPGNYFYTYFKAHDFTVDMANMTNAATSMGIYTLYAYGGTVENVNVINQPASAYALYEDQHTYTTDWKNCDFGGLTGVINLTGVGSGSVTTQTFIGCSWGKMIAYDVSAISVQSCIVQGDLTPKFDLEEIYGMSVTACDLEGTGTLYDFGTNTMQFVSMNNALVGFSGTYSTGTFVSGMLLDQIYPVTVTGNPLKIKNQAITAGAVTSGYITAMEINGVIQESIAYNGLVRKLIQNTSGVANVVDLEFKNLGGSSYVGRGASDETYLTGTANKKVVLKQGNDDKLGVTADGYLQIDTFTSPTVGAAGGASGLPATPSGYVVIKIGGVPYKFPYYAN